MIFFLLIDVETLLNYHRHKRKTTLKILLTSFLLENGRENVLDRVLGGNVKQLNCMWNVFSITVVNRHSYPRGNQGIKERVRAR